MWNQGECYNESSMAGGYTQSPGGFASPALFKGGEKKGNAVIVNIYHRLMLNLLFCSWLKSVCVFVNNCLFQVTLVGVIRSTDKSMTNIQYKVDDMTGAPMDVKQWVDMEVSSVDHNLLTQGIYVLKLFINKSQCQILNFLNSPKNKLVHVHLLHLKLSKKFVYVSHFLAIQSKSISISLLYVKNKEVTHNLAQVLSLIRSCPYPQGISIQELKQRLSGISLSVIKQAVEFLSNEGHIFSTIDEDHYKSTDNDE
uniref:Replication protein A C-terminal domain-containing protein n=1 Tax=Tetraodon nigroviridis TaxID=99883 RepID=H3CD80_TETNG